MTELSDGDVAPVKKPLDKRLRRPKVNYMMSDWPENVTMTGPLFAQVRYIYKSDQ